MRWRFVAFLILLLSVHLAQGKADGVIKGTFAAKYRFLDSLSAKLRLSHNVNRPEFNSVVTAFDDLEKKAIAAGDKELVDEILLLKISLQLKYNIHFGIEMENTLITLAEEAHNDKLQYVEAYALQVLGDYYYFVDKYNDGFESYLSAYEVYAPFSANEYPAKEAYLFILGSAYYRYGDNENALKYIKESVTQVGSVLKSSFTNYNTIGLCYRNMGKYDSAEWYFRTVYNEAVLVQDSIWAGIVSGNIAINYYYEKKYDKAIPLLEEDIRRSLAQKVIKNAVGSMYILGALYFQKQEFDNSEKVVLNAIDVCRGRAYWHDFALAEKIYTLAFKVYAAKHEPGLATLYADSAFQARDSNVAKNGALLFTKKQEKIDSKRRRLASKQLTEQKQINFFLAIVSLLLFIIGVLAYLNQRMTARLNKQITSQKKELEQLNEVKDKIFSVISHDMRTPVNSLIAFTELLERGNISEAKMAAYAAALKSNLGYTARLLENLLNWARTQMYGFKPVFETFSLLEAIDMVLELVQHEADKKGVLIKKEFQQDALLYADVNMFSLTIRNLLSNAIKYTAGGGSITLSSKVVNGKIQIIVKDTGTGIAPEMVTSFNDSKSAQPIASMPGTNHEKGTGLGLILCKTFVALMHGRMHLESTEGEGSTFTVALPSGN